MILFEWDPRNIRHIVEDYPQRGNTIIEVESIFSDPEIKIKRATKTDDEQRFAAIGIGASGIVKVVVFIINTGCVRPISCWPANPQTKRFYYESSKK